MATKSLHAIRFVALRRSKCLSQHEAAELVGVRPNTWARWEQGRALPRIIALDEVLEKFGWTLSQFADQNFWSKHLTDEDRQQLCLFS
jgi:transcriptional regulator with XRE-family HTH domain